MAINLRDLVDIGLNVDLSGLRDVLTQMKDRVDGLQTRVGDLEHEDVHDHDHDGEYAEEDHYHDAYADVDHEHEGLLTTDNAYDAISDRVYDMVKDVVREDLDEKDFADSDHDHDGIYASVDDHNELEERVSTLEAGGGLEDLEERVEKLEGLEPSAAFEDLRKEFTQKVYDLESKLQDQARAMEALANQTQDAITFFGLIRRAAEIILGRN